MSSQPAKRVRTGCLKCRVRRRKCDEGKPRCRRCIKGGFECQYGTRLSFLQKNAFTIDTPVTPTTDTTPTSSAASSAATAPPPPPQPSYRKVQFVDETEGKQRLPPAPDAHQPATPCSWSSHEPSPHPENATGSAVGRVPVRGGEEYVQQQPPPQSNAAQQPSLPFVNWGADVLGSPEASGGDQIALDALLSLGNEQATVFLDEGVHRGSVGSLPVHDAHSSAVVDEVSAAHGGSAQDAPVDLIPVGLGLSDEGIFGLLKNYRYEVAPWLDICDLGQTFGVAVPCLAAESGPILQHVISLSEISLKSHSKFEGSFIPEHRAAAHAHINGGTSEEERLVCASLIGAAEVFSDTFFNRQDRKLRGLNDFPTELFLSDSASPVAIGAYYLLLRLEMSRSLIHELPITGTARLRDTLPSHWHRTDLARQVFQCAHTPLILCIRAMDLCWGEDIDRFGPSGDMVGTWSSLVDELNAWFHQRPQEFNAMVEFDNGDDAFPVVLFTSGAAVFGNQMYHTAMLVLLRHKPRTFMIPVKHRSSTLSYLWHARRICGIALNNDRRECWDMSLVASFFLAARTMTHEAQHEVLLAGTDKVAALTGWSLGAVRNILQAAFGI